ncbi:hypothetical protein [Candidatus Frankia alpina]|uniref:hypothetical protein n=1 Tax=Candidatus Frankia alpina TaxID=2699483 RepID=UPI001F43FBEB|nr:hypothetical protein [Candidatus Frankia alpina]
MKWQVHQERSAFRTPWVNIAFLDVEQPDGQRGEYHVVRLRDVAVTALLDESRRVLMLWRHRFVSLRS